MKIFSLKVLVPCLILFFAAAGAFALVETSPKVPRKPPVVVSPTVETAVFEKKVNPIRIRVMGTVIAARELTLKSRVAGEVVSVNPQFVPGGFFAQGEEILRIDPQDYQLAINEMQAEVTNAEYDLKLELGYQNVAAREWKLLRSSSKDTVQDAELALRKPHLKKAQTALEAARAKLRQAQLDLERTRVTAPFAAMVESKNAVVGASIAAQETLATLMGTDEFWVQVSVPVDRLGRIIFPSQQQPGAKVTIVSGSNGNTVEREGRVIRLLPSLESEGRMARVLVSIQDPLNLKRKPGLSPLLLGSYVTAYIDGGVLENSYAIPRKAFRDNGKIWVLGQDGHLDIREVSAGWRDEDFILLTQGLAPGERVVMSALSAPLQGMKLNAGGPSSGQGIGLATDGKAVRGTGEGKNNG